MAWHQHESIEMKNNGEEMAACVMLIMKWRKRQLMQMEKI